MSSFSYESASTVLSIIEFNFNVITFSIFPTIKEVGSFNLFRFLNLSLVSFKILPYQSSSGVILFFNNSLAYYLATNLSASSLDSGFFLACSSNCLSRIGKNFARFKPYYTLSYSLLLFILPIIARRNSRKTISRFVNLLA